MPPATKLLLTLGAAFIGLGLLWWLGGRWLGWLGHLPGDIRIEGKKGGFYFPLTTCLLVSIVLSVILWLIRRFPGS